RAAPRTGAGRSSSRSSTRAPVSRPSSGTASSNPSSRPGEDATGRGSGSPWRGGSSRNIRDGSTWLPGTARARCSPSRFPPERERTMAGEHILLAEDDRDLRLFLGEVLDGAGYRVRAVASGAEALHALRDREIDLVVTDLIMPGASGSDVLQVARELRPDV